MSRYGFTANDIKLDLAPGKGRPEWIFSAYAPNTKVPRQLFGGPQREQSFEEMRLRHYEAAAAGNMSQAIQEAQALWQECVNQLDAALNDPEGAVKYIVDGANEHPNRIDMVGGNQGQNFGLHMPGAAFNMRDPSQKLLSGVQAPGQPSAFGQPSALGQPSAFGQSSKLGQGTAFGQPSTLGGGAQPAFGKPAFGQSGFAQVGANTPAFGQTGFGQPTAAPAPAPAPAPFGAPSAPSLGQPSAPTGGFGQPAAPAFGQPSAPGGGFGQPAAPSTIGQPSALTGFGKPSQGPSPFGLVKQPQEAKPSPFGQPSTTTSSFPAPPPFGQPAPPQGVPVQAVSAGPRAFIKIDDPQQLNPLPDLQGQTMRDPNTKKLTMWKGRPVQYVNDHPCYLHPQDNKTYVRINFPDGPPDDATLRDSQGKADQYTPEVEEAYKFFLDNGYFKDGVIPSVPPKRDWISFDF